MKRMIWIAGIALALMTGVASANPCTGTNINNCQNGNNNKINSPSQSQQQQQGQAQGQWSNNVNNNKAYGGQGGAGGAGGAGGNANQSQSSTNTNQNVNDNSNSGNSQSTVFNDRLQAPAVSSFIAASGPCTGISGGGAVSVAGFGIGASFASLEEDCKKRELLRIGFASGNQQIEAAAAQGWMTMFNDQFPQQKGGQQTGALPVAATSQTASAAVVCPDLPLVTHLACMAKASAQ